MSDSTDDLHEIEPGSAEDPFAEYPRLGSLLRHYRRRAGLSQRELADESGVEQSNISLIERGETRNPWNATLETLAATLARHIPDSPARQIADRLVEAKNLKPTEYYGVDSEAVVLSDRLATYNAQIRHAIYEAINRIIDVFEAFGKAGRY